MSKDTMQLQDVDIVFNYSLPSGETVSIKSSINNEGMWQQWGAEKERLGENVNLIKEIAVITSQYLIT